jgi:hypothetical protein
MNDDHETRIWEGMRAHLDELGRMTPPPDLAALRERAMRPKPGLNRYLLTVAGSAVVVLLAVFVAGQAGLFSRGVGRESDVEANPDALHRQAQAALERWAVAAADAKTGSIVIVGELTGQIGDWEEPVGDNNKLALMSGLLEAPAGLPTATPSPGVVRWSDGTSKVLPLLSADEAMKQLIASAGSKCPGCRPLEITSAQLTTGSIQTSRGPATVPLWEFGVAGSAVRITYVAVAGNISVIPAPFDPYNAPGDISIESASGSPQSKQLTVSFGGAPLDAQGVCGANYTAEAVESDLAVVVIVIEHSILDPEATPAGCRLVAVTRTASVTLSAPLGNRVVLEVNEGLPVPVRAP